MNHRQFQLRRICGLLGSFLFSLTTLVFANPDGPQVVHGRVTMTRPDPASLNIENSPNAIINWKSFSIGHGETTRFVQQDPSSAVLNRVKGEDPSALLGRLLSNGRVFLINPNGMVFGPDAVIDTAGFIGSTLDIKDDDFLAGRLNFEGGPDAGSIENRGLIQSRDDGGVYLIAPSIENSGIIRTETGDLVLAAGRKITISSLDLDHISFEIQAPEDEVVNVGKLLTSGGATGVFAGTIRNHGIVEAETLALDAQGNIRLAAQAGIELEAGSVVSASGPQGGNVHIEAETGTTRASGTIEAKGLVEKGGEVQVLGEAVVLNDTAVIDVSGEQGGGTVLVGGDYKGQGEVLNATSTYVGPDASIDASAVTEGDGGKVIVWADDTTQYHGAISVRGGASAGDGGFVEVSGKKNLAFDGSVDAGADVGSVGTLLLDPADIIVGQFIIPEGLDDGELDSDVPNPGDPEGQILATDSPNDTFLISEQKLETLSDNANVILEATDDIRIGIVDLDQPVSDDESVVLDFNTSPAGSVTFRSGSFHISEQSAIHTQGGAVTIEAAGISARSAGSIEITTNGGDIDLLSSAGFDMDFLLLDSSTAEVGAGGDITVSAVAGDIMLTGRPLNLNASGAAGAGNISITSEMGSVDIGNIDASSGKGEGGDIVLAAAGDISTGSLDSSGFFSAGNISLDSANGSIATDFASEGPPLNPINATSSDGAAGSVRLAAAQGIAVGSIDASGAVQGGDITVSGDVIDLTGSVLTSGGNVGFKADADGDGAGNFQIADQNTIQTQGGAVTIEGAGIAATAGGIEIITNGGDIDLLSSAEFNIANLLLDSSTADPATGSGGNIAVSAAAGDIVLTGQPLNLKGVDSTGSVSINSESGGVDIGNIDTSSAQGDGGDIMLAAAGDISTGSLDSSGSSSAGNISLDSASGSITTEFAFQFPPRNPISATSTSGAGGDIGLTAAQGISVGSIDASGAAQGGDITVTGDVIGLTGFVQTSGGDIGVAGNEIDIVDLDSIESTGAGGSIAVNGSVQTGGNDLTMTAGEGIAISGNLMTAGGNIDLQSTSITLDTAVLNALDFDTKTAGSITLAAGGIGTDDSTLITDQLALGGPVSGSTALTLLPATTGRTIDIGSETDPFLPSTNVDMLGEFSGQLSVGGSIGTSMPASTQAIAGDINITSDFTVNGDLTLVSLGDISVASGGLLQSGGTLTLAALGNPDTGSAGDIRDPDTSEARLFFVAPDVVFFANNEVGTQENPLTTRSGASTVDAGAGTGLAFLNGAPGEIVGSGREIQEAYNAFQSVNINLDSDILNTEVVNLSAEPEPLPPELVPPEEYPPQLPTQPRVPPLAKSTTSQWNSEVSHLTTLDQWMETGPQLPKVVDMSHLEMEVLVAPNQTIVIHFNPVKEGVDVMDIRFLGSLSWGQKEPVPLDFEVRYGNSGVASARIPDSVSFPIIVRLVIDAFDLAGKLAAIHIYGVGILPKAEVAEVKAGAAAQKEAESREDRYEITDISFGPPKLIRPQDGQVTKYSFLSPVEFRKAQVEFCRVDPTHPGTYDTVREEPSETIPEGWVGKDGSRRWNGLDNEGQISLGQHELRIKGWNRDEPPLWYIGQSDSRVTVLNGE